jgi:predicted nucleic acid-binding protein
MSGTGTPRLFLDSNVLTGGLVAPWGLDKAILSMCASRIFRLVLAEYVRLEVETNLLSFSDRIPAARLDQVLDDYGRFLRLAKPEIIPLPDASRVSESRHLIRHAADVPVLLSAIDAKPGWLLTHNTDHFTSEVAARTGLRIGTPADFFRQLADEIGS